MGDFDKAIVEYRRSIELEPVFVYCHIQLAVAQYKSGSVDKALHQFRRFLVEYPDSPEVFNYYGELLLDQQRYEEAVSNFETSIELDKNTFVPLLLLPRAPLLTSMPATQGPSQRPPHDQPSSRHLPMEAGLFGGGTDLSKGHLDRPALRRRVRYARPTPLAAEQDLRRREHVCQECRDVEDRGRGLQRLVVRECEFPFSLSLSVLEGVGADALETRRPGRRSRSLRRTLSTRKSWDSLATAIRRKGKDVLGEWEPLFATRSLGSG